MLYLAELRREPARAVSVHSTAIKGRPVRNNA
jgi:hypothetical protein